MATIKRVYDKAVSPTDDAGFWLLQPGVPVEALGFLPQLLNWTDGSIEDQLNVTYAHGGGWQPFGKDQWKLTFDPESTPATLQYPGDPAYTERARFILKHGETFLLFDHSLSVAVQNDGSFEVSRLD